MPCICICRSCSSSFSWCLPWSTSRSSDRASNATPSAPSPSTPQVLCYIPSPVTITSLPPPHHVSGLVLGFGDPTITTTAAAAADFGTHTNVRGVQTPLPPEWCTAPLNSTTMHVPSEGRSAVTAYDAISVMASPSISSRSHACLSGADLDGLQHLYPDCSRPHHGPPICIEARLHPYVLQDATPCVTGCNSMPVRLE